MKLKERVISKTILKALKSFPAIVLTGPRQAGKTTLLKTLFVKTHAFVSLEDPDARLLAKEDPRRFFEQYRPPLILDEIQYVPDLLSYIKTRIDEDRKPGQWLITGSQNFTLMKNVTQSLAGRAAVLTLLPFSYAEKLETAETTLNVTAWLQNLAKLSNPKALSLSDWLLRGAYPEIATHPQSKVDRQLWCGSYITTYLERDIRNLSAIGDLNEFERFLRLCATRTGQILNLTDMARDIGIAVPTAKRWLSILEAGHQVYLLYPYYRNIGKRLVKNPKLYFVDTALASYLLGLHEKETLFNSPSFGALFETMIVIDILKRFLNFGELPSMYYLRTRDGLEVDVVIEQGDQLHCFEIKSSMTVTPRHTSSLSRIKNDLGPRLKTAGLISRSAANSFLPGGFMSYTYKNVLI